MATRPAGSGGEIRPVGNFTPEGSRGSRPMVFGVPHEPTSCTGRNADGQPCKAKLMKDSTTCFFHSERNGNSN